MERLGEEKLALMREILELSRQQLLLVDLDDLTPILEQKAQRIARMKEVDLSLAEKTGGQGGEPPWQGEMNRLVEAILENERTMEERIEKEQMELIQDMQALERQGQVKQYLEGARGAGRSVNLKR